MTQMGGGVMRAAAKVANFGINGGLRGVPAAPLGEQSVATVSRKTPRPSPAIVSSTATEEGKFVGFLSSQDGKIEAVGSVQRPSWEIDDWEFAGDDEELLLDSMNPMPRIVFGGVPTLEEAKEATSDLKDALEKVYFSSSNASGCIDPVAVVQESTKNSEFPETKVCVTSETTVSRPSAPIHALQAFKLLKESAEAQSVVASLVSDKNVWDAVMKNEEVVEFLQSQHTSADRLGMDVNVNKSFADGKFNGEESSESIYDEVDEDHRENRGDGFMGWINNVKLTVMKMVSSVSEFFHHILGGDISVDGNGNGTTATVERTITSSFMALAVLAIMVVVLKRG
ncbi:PREDICTED: uncharacterized protein LOC104604963 [Nelumbo nucifera]|uniref:Uncharacterized protein LOC104604963 n=1 Tax=Nelumbo nucifera TaxID=4432 RepID=A0A1U8AJL1_NELNU|nr:PREDICTED: uncharacterized protein LOC104604963 [Nelumbo nucifera]